MRAPLCSLGGDTGNLVDDVDVGNIGELEGVVTSWDFALQFACSDVLAQLKELLQASGEEGTPLYSDSDTQAVLVLEGSKLGGAVGSIAGSGLYVEQVDGVDASFVVRENATHLRDCALVTGSCAQNALVEAWDGETLRGELQGIM